MEKLSSIIIFYKPFFYWSFGINIVMTIFNPRFIPVIATKFILVGFLWYFLSQGKGKKILNLYRNLGISNFMLFASVFILDVIISTLYLFLIKEFI